MCEAKNEFGTVANMHLTCTNQSSEMTGNETRLQLKLVLLSDFMCGDIFRLHRFMLLPHGEAILGCCPVVPS